MVTGAVRRHVARWDGWDWAGLTLAAASAALLIWTVASGAAWAGFELVVTAALMGAGLGGVLLLGPGRPADDETEEARDE